MQTAENLFRKQFLISRDQIEKINILAKAEGTSAASIVRKAIDAYDPDNPHGMDESELFELVALRVKEAISQTQHTNTKLDTLLKTLNVEDDSWAD